MCEIGRQLGVGYALEVRVRKTGYRVRITAQLLNAADGYHLWPHSYDRTLDDAFAIQTDIAKRMVDALQVTLSPVAQDSLGRGYLAWMENDEDLANLRGDPRFTAIIDRLRSADSA